MINDLIIQNVSKKIGGLQVLKNIQAVVPEGKITAFIGPNGAGKTTLFNIISGDLNPDSGSITFGEKEIGGLSPYLIGRAGIGRLFQDICIFEGLTALENVIVSALPISMQSIWNIFFLLKTRKKKLKLAREEALSCLDYVGLSDQRNKITKDLSHGQQKLVAIARLLAKKSKLLLLDEPTAGLSPPMVEQVSSLINRIVEEHRISVAIVEHNMTVVSNVASWVYFMHEGSIAFNGEKDRVLENMNVRELFMGF